VEARIADDAVEGAVLLDVARELLAAASRSVTSNWSSAPSPPAARISASVASASAARSR
jgi:hypothetical protein